MKSIPITGSLVDGMSVLAFSKCDKKAALICTMKLEVTKYNTLVAGIPPLSQRQKANKAGKLQGTFDIGQWWLKAKQQLPASFQLLRAVLTHAPNSIPPERVFSILTTTFNELQDNARADYMELTCELVYNGRGRKK